MKKLVISGLFIFFLSNCANSSSVSSDTPKPTPPTPPSQIAFTDSSSPKIEGTKNVDGDQLMYSLTKTSEKNYRLLITTYKDSEDHRTIQTVYKSSIGVEKNGSKFTVKIRYAEKPNLYSWQTMPQNSFNQVYHLSKRSISYVVNGKLAQKTQSKVKGKTQFPKDALHKEKLIRMSLDYFMSGYKAIFHMK